MAFIEGANWGVYGQEFSGSLRAGTAIVGSAAEYTLKKFEPTFAMMRETFWYEVGKVTKRVNTQYLRPVRTWLR